METIPLAEAKAHLSAIAEQLITTHDLLEVTKHGKRALVIMSADEFDSREETLYWLSVPGIHQTIAEAQADVDAGRTFTSDEVRQHLLERAAAADAS